MPSAQVIDFGEDPYADAMGGFAKNFLGTLNEKAAQRRNESIFQKIREKYGPDAEPEQIFRDVLEAQGLDPEYKRNKLNEVKEYATLSAKKNISPYQQAMLEHRQEELNLKRKKLDSEGNEKPITPYQQKVLANQEVRLDLEKKKLERAAKEQSQKLPQYIEKYTSGLLKDAEVNLPAHDRADLNNFMEQLILEDGIGVSEAFNRAYQYIQARRDKIEEAKITERPTRWVGNPDPRELEESMDQAYEQLLALHDEDGVENQKELRKIAERAGWKPEEITQILNRIFQKSGKHLRGPKTKTVPSAEKAAQIPFEQQGKTSEAVGVDEILFGVDEILFGE
jgi:hypothetical protein